MAAEETKPVPTGGIPLDQWSGAYATKELHNTMKAFVHSSDKASRRMLQLTWAIMGLTAVMWCAVGIQITIALL
jgi:hypothetical protein